MIKEYCDMLFESRAVDKLNKDIKNNPEINFKIIGYNVIPREFGPALTFILLFTASLSNAMKLELRV